MWNYINASKICGERDRLLVYLKINLKNDYLGLTKTS